MFQYNLYKDKGTTGRLECTVYMGTKDLSSGAGKVIHSKVETGKYIADDYPGFLEKLAEVINK